MKTAKWFILGSATGVVISVGLFALLAYLLLRPSGLLFGGLPVGSSAPAFAAKTVAGQEIRLNDLRGKVVILRFWSPECELCQDEIPSVKSFVESLDTGVAFLSVASRASQESVRSFSRAKAINYPVVIDDMGKIAELYNITSVPFTYVIDSAGKITATGVPSLARIKQEISRCVNGSCVLK